MSALNCSWAFSCINNG